MAFQIKKRNINVTERFACNEKDVKALFADLDVYVSFGYLSRSFSFASCVKRPPKIRGTIIASASVHANTDSNFLCFYVIKDSNFTDAKSKEFSEICLPKIYNWLEKSLQMVDTEILGALSSKVFIIELHENKFYFYDYHY